VVTVSDSGRVSSERSEGGIGRLRRLEPFCVALGEEQQSRGTTDYGADQGVTMGDKRFWENPRG